LAIRNKYISIRYEHGITDKDVSKWIFIVAGSASVIVLFFLLWNQQLGRKVSERTSQLTESEARFRATFAQAAVGIAHVSMAGKFMRVNRKFCDIVGYSEKEMLELTFQDITHPDDLDTDLEYVRRVLNGERESYSLEKRYFKKDGSVVWINLTVSLLFDKEGDPRYFVSVVRDISERKRAEEALRESEREMSTLREELIHATRRMALGELTTAIAHELNQPLAAIMTNAQAAKRFLKRDTPSLEDVEEILDDIVKDDRRAGDIIGKLRGMLKGQQHDFVEIHVNEMIQEVLALVRGDMLLRKIVVETTLAKDIPPLSGDRTQLQQVFLNLMLNAAESLVAVEKNARRITVAARDKDNKEVWVSIGDTGPGFDDAAKDQLFDPFYTTKDEGMGVGLAISSTIVKLHGGRIQAESSHGGGATFHVVLPCPEEG
jgi:PAS domain S-box-containing protein